MLYKTLKKLKERNGLTEDLKNKIDIPYHLCYSNTVNFSALKRNTLKQIGENK